MTDVFTLCELSDESPSSPLGFSPRLVAVLDRLSANEVRISNALMNAAILTVAALQELTDEQLRRMKNIGDKYIKDIDTALASFDLARKEHAIIVRANANPIEAHVQRLLRWIDERMSLADAEESRCGSVEAANEITEREVLADVMLILDGRAPTNKRRWSIEEIDKRQADRKACE